MVTAGLSNVPGLWFGDEGGLGRHQRGELEGGGGRHPVVVAAAGVRLGGVAAVGLLEEVVQHLHLHLLMIVTL